MQRAATAFGVFASIFLSTLSGKAASAQPIPSPYAAPDFALPTSPQSSAPQLDPIPQLYAHARSAPLSVTATVQSSCTFEDHSGNTITMSCSFDTPLAAAYIGLGQGSYLPTGTFAMRKAGTLSQQGLTPLCGFNLDAPGTAEQQPYFSTFEVCF